MLATIINALAIVTGSLIGLLLRKGLPERFKGAVFAACEELSRADQPLDPVLVNQRLDARGLLGDLVPRELVFGLARGVRGRLTLNCRVDAALTPSGIIPLA